MELLDELERLAGLGLPEWAPELTDQADPVIAELAAAMTRDRAVRDEVIARLLRTRSPIVKDWLRCELSPDLFLPIPEGDEEFEPVVDAVGLRLPTTPAVFLAEDSISVSPKELRTLAEPWKRWTGSWFFGRPQASTTLSAWPIGPRGQALDFLCQVNMRRARHEIPYLGATGLPGKLCLQIYVDLDIAVGPMDHLVLALARGEHADHLMEPPAGCDVPPMLINPIGVRTIPRPDDPQLDLNPADEDFYRFLYWHADEEPYANNLWSMKSKHSRWPAEPCYRRFVPMARLGGFIPADPEIWREPVRQALGCEPADVVLLYDGPVDPEPRAIDDPEHNRIMILVERSRLAARDFTRTLALAY